MGFLFGKKKSYEKALDWYRDNRVAGKGIIVHTRLQEPYPEVTGYFIPTLYAWGEDNLAREAVNWLISIQSNDGSFPAPDGTPYTFDTGQIMRGLCAALGDVDGAEDHLERACDWVLTQIDDSGRLLTPSTELWGDIANDMIHTYVLPPLREAGEKLNKDEYIKAADCVLAYYKSQDELVPFNRLSHFHAYIMEALCELDEIELASRGMAEVERLQRKDGSIPAYPDVTWVCSTGMAQYAVIWYLLGKAEPANRAIRYLEKIQNKSGGFYGSYGEGSDYIPNAEISWAVKYFLDAYRLKLQREKPGA